LLPSSARSYPEKPDSYKKALSPPAPASTSSPIPPKRKRESSPDQEEAIPDSAPHLSQDRFPGPDTVYSIVPDPPHSHSQTGHGSSRSCVSVHTRHFPDHPMTRNQAGQPT